MKTIFYEWIWHTKIKGCFIQLQTTIHPIQSDPEPNQLQNILVKLPEALGLWSFTILKSSVLLSCFRLNCSQHSISMFGLVLLHVTHGSFLICVLLLHRFSVFPPWGWDFCSSRIFLEALTLTPARSGSTNITLVFTPTWQQMEIGPAGEVGQQISNFFKKLCGQKWEQGLVVPPFFTGNKKL